jgi:hypothetical protein
MRAKDEKEVRGLEAEINEIKTDDKGKFALFLEKFGYQLIIQALSIVIAGTLFYAATTNALENIKKDVNANAQEIATVKSEGSIPVKIMEEKLDNLIKSVQEIKAANIRIEDKIDDFYKK